MFEWHVKDMKLMNEKGRMFFGDERIYMCEAFVPRDEKIAFVDFMQAGKLSHILNLIEKFNEDAPNMPKDNYGNVKTVSLKAWIKKNDTKYTRPVLDTDYHYGQYYMLGCKRNILYSHKGSFDTYEDLVDEIFHRQLKDCEKREQAYFLEHDELSILRKTFREKYDKFNTAFGVSIAISGSHMAKVFDDENGQTRELTVEELKELLAKYDELEAFIAKLSSNTNIKF